MSNEIKDGIKLYSEMWLNDTERLYRERLRLKTLDLSNQDFYKNIFAFIKLQYEPKEIILHCYAAWLINNPNKSYKDFLKEIIDKIDNLQITLEVLKHFNFVRSSKDLMVKTSVKLFTENPSELLIQIIVITLCIDYREKLKHRDFLFLNSTVKRCYK